MEHNLGLEEFDSVEKLEGAATMIRHALYHLAMVAHQLEFTAQTTLSEEEIMQVALLYELSEKLADRFAPQLAEHV